MKDKIRKQNTVQRAILIKVIMKCDLRPHSLGIAKPRYNSVSLGTPKRGTTSRLTGAGSLLPPVYSEVWAKENTEVSLGYQSPPYGRSVGKGNAKDPQNTIFLLTGHHTWPTCRIEDIQKLTEPSKWHHCPGKENPANIISRGISARELKDSELWWHGPPWLQQAEQFWPRFENQNVSNLDLELKNTLKKSGALETEELKKSEEYWIKEIQKETFISEIIDLEKAQKVSGRYKICTLMSCLDDRKILRIKGRLDESELSLDEKQPILLPSNGIINFVLAYKELS
ncbi:uncharacterized protein TNCV_4769761 [Trichonephila clavipes]|nr:uncharacterized protein TNCV_4769761 [Trichonephila clavipes]